MLGMEARLCIPQLATYSWRLPTRATTAVVPTSAALSAFPNSSSVRLNASVSALSNFSELKGTPSSALPDSASSMAEVRKVSLSLPSLSSFPGCRVYKAYQQAAIHAPSLSHQDVSHAMSPPLREADGHMSDLGKIFRHALQRRTDNKSSAQ